MAFHRKSPRFPPQAKLKDCKKFHQEWLNIKFSLNYFYRSDPCNQVPTPGAWTGGQSFVFCFLIVTYFILPRMLIAYSTFHLKMYPQLHVWGFWSQHKEWGQKWFRSCTFGPRVDHNYQVWWVSAQPFRRSYCDWRTDRRSWLHYPPLCIKIMGDNQTVKGYNYYYLAKL